MSEVNNSFGFVRVALCRPHLEVANVKVNTKKIIEIITSYSSKSQFLCFPELAITGYTCGDLFHEQFLLDEALNSLKQIESVSKKYPNVVLIVGLPFRYNSMIFNTAAIFNQGQLLALVPKSYLPDYAEFKEKIYFHSALNQTISINLDHFDYPIIFGKHVIFKDFFRSDLLFGIEICEDLWSVEPPSGKLALQGASLIFNISASNEIIGKYEFRRRLIQHQSERLIAAYCYISSGLGESTSELVFSGYVSIYENGKLLNESQRFSNDTAILTADVDIDLLLNERSRNTVWGDCVRENSDRYQILKFSTYQLDFTKDNLARNVNPFPFIPDLQDSQSIADRCKEIVSIQSSALAMRFVRSKAENFVIAVSGGLDSTLALLVTIESAKILNISREKILALTMPGLGTTDTTKSNIQELCKALDVKLDTISIVNSIKQHFKDIKQDPNTFDITYENAQARERTQILFDKANQINGIVVGTGDLSEIALGWSTFNGDHMSSYNVNCSIPKTLVKLLIKWFAESNLEFKENRESLLKVLSLPISPELLPSKNQELITQKTEDLIGPFELHDFFLYNFIRYRFYPKKIFFLAKIAFEGKYSEADLKKFLNIFLKRFFTNQFKRSSMPEGPKIGLVSLSPRSDWRVPGDISGDSWLL